MEKHSKHYFRLILFSIFVKLDSTASDNDSTYSHSYTSYQSEIICTPSYPIEYPSTVAEIQGIILRAISLKTTVKALGSRHSVLDTICTEGIPIDMHKLKGCQIDPSSYIVTAESGTVISDLILFLKQNGRALGGHLPSFGGVTVGGLLGSGARGSSLLHPTSLSDLIISLQFIDGDGNLQEINQDHTDFNSFRVNLGLLGIIVQVSMNTIPAYKMRIQHYQLKEEEVIFGSHPNILGLSREADWFQAWWFPNTHSVVIANGTFLPFDSAGNAKTYMIPENNEISSMGIRSAFELSESFENNLGMLLLEKGAKLSLITKIPGRSAIFSENEGLTLKNPAVGYVHDLTTNECQQCIWSHGPSKSTYFQETGFSLDLSKFQEAIQKIQKILKQTPVFFPVYGIFIRFSPPSNGLMSVEFGRETVHFEIVTPMRTDPFGTGRKGLAGYQAISQTLVDLGGRPQWSMCGQVYHTREMFIKNCPNLRRFQALLRKYDPNGRFLNKFGERITGTSNELTIDPRVRHCALQEYCICKENNDCGKEDKCTSLEGYNVCLG